jgi:hypothetical protein
MRRRQFWTAINFVVQGLLDFRWETVCGANAFQLQPSREPSVPVEVAMTWSATWSE